MAAAGTLTDTVPATTEVELVIGGMTCAACSARVQTKLNKLNGVSATVNLSTERAYITAPPQVGAGELIGVVEAAGYTAELAVPAGADAGAGADEITVQRLRRRLILALVFFVPLTDLSIVLSIFPWTRAEQAAQVIPPMTSSTSVVAGTVSVSVPATVTSATSAGLGITHRPDPGGSMRLNLLPCIVVP